MVTKLKRLFPVMGRRRIADFLARAGLHIAPSTVRRMLNRPPASETQAPVAPAKNSDEPLSSAKPRKVIANYPNHVWGIDTTAVPTSMGFWTSWLPFSLTQSWPVFWWVEPRARYPAKGACAAPWAPARAKIGELLELVATPFQGARHLAQIES